MKKKLDTWLIFSLPSGNKTIVYPRERGLIDAGKPYVEVDCNNTPSLVETAIVELIAYASSQSWILLKLNGGNWTNIC